MSDMSKTPDGSVKPTIIMRDSGWSLGDIVFGSSGGDSGGGEAGLLYRNDFSAALIQWDGSWVNRYRLENNEMIVTVGPAGVERDNFGYEGRKRLTSLGLTPGKELWVKWRQMIPANATVRIAPSTGSDTSRDTKIGFAISGIEDGYSTNDISDSTNVYKENNGVQLPYSFNLRLHGRAPRSSGFWGINSGGKPFPEMYAYVEYMMGMQFNEKNRNSSGHGYGMELRDASGNLMTYSDPGTWDTFVMRVVRNTPGARDGIIQIWMNGVRGFSATDVQLTLNDIIGPNCFGGVCFSNGSGSGEEYRFDYMELWDRQPDSLTDAPPTATDLIVNPSFDSDINSWSRSASTTLAHETTKVYSGGGSLRMTSSVTGELKAFSEYFAVDPVKLYNFRAYTRADTTGRSAGLQVDWFDSATVYISSDYHYATNSTSWGQRQISNVQPPSNAAKATVTLVINNAAANEAHYFDAIMAQSA